MSMKPLWGTLVFDPGRPIAPSFNSGARVLWCQRARFKNVDANLSATVNTLQRRKETMTINRYNSVDAEAATLHSHQLSAPLRAGVHVALFELWSGFGVFRVAVTVVLGQRLVGPDVCALGRVQLVA